MRDIVHKDKRYIVLTPDEVRVQAWLLASKILADVATFKPNFLVALWRGGASVGVYIQEYLKRAGVDVDHVCIRTSSYTAPGEQSSHIDVHTLGYVTKSVKPTDRLLIVDDIFDSGRSLKAVVDKLEHDLGGAENMPQVRIATLFWKPENNKTSLKPDYFVFNEKLSDAWVVFPHEVSDFPNDNDLLTVLGDAASILLFQCQTANVASEACASHGAES